MTAASAAAHHSDRRLKVSLPECLRSAVSQGNADVVEQLLDSGILPGPDKVCLCIEFHKEKASQVRRLVACVSSC